jgi:hypothetical protein
MVEEIVDRLDVDLVALLAYAAKVGQGKLDVKQPVAVGMAVTCPPPREELTHTAPP